MRLTNIYAQLCIAIALLVVTTNHEHKVKNPTVAYAQCKIDILDGVNTKGKAYFDNRLQLLSHRAIRYNLKTEISIILHKLCKEHYTNE